MERSLFADGFFREMIYTRVDALNMLYVATTRAKEQLHMFLLKPKSSYKPKKESKKPTSTVSSLLLEMYAELMQQPEGANYRCYEIGTFDSPEPSKAEESVSSCRNVVLNKRHTSPVTLKLRTSVGRYFADEKSDLSPRSMGIRLHRAFEGATTRDEIFAALEEMTLNGELQRAEVEELKMQVTATLDKTVAGEWFDGSWSQLYRERNIIRPNAPSKRPDRVLTRGSEAVVIDYKFGEEKSSYNRQVSKYMSELRQMGYTSVKGYVWYVPIGKIDSSQE
jgi:ATP-dependent exoDNAse (exonuclease V) beta subunit